MKVMTLVEAIDGIDDELLSGAIVYQQKRTKKWNQHKLARWGALAACLCLFVIGAFVMHHIQDGYEQPGAESPAGQGFFNATVTDISDDSIIVECFDSILGSVTVEKKIQITTDTISSEEVPKLKIGDNVRILYIGNITENGKEPLILERTIAIFLLDENGEVIVEDGS